MPRGIEAHRLSRNILISPLEGEKKFLSELSELRNFREGYNLKYSCRHSNADLQLHSEMVQKNKNKDCGTKSAMTGFGAKSIILFSGMYRSCFCRSALLCRQGKNSYNKLVQHKKELKSFEPSPAFVMLTGVRKRLLPLTKREGSDSVISNNFSDTVFSRFTSHFSLKRTAFTLAEVLITLGIIGVVASLTLPSVIHDYKIKQLRTGFLRSSSMIQNALNQTANEFGYSNYKELNSICGNVGKGDSASACKNENDILFKEINADFLSRFKGLKTMKSTDFWSLKNNTTNFSGTTKFNYGDLYGITGWGGTHASAYFVADGTLITSIAFYYHEPSDGLSISFDTNGPYKGPNRYGYDIFLFNTGTWYKFCSQKSDGGLYNGRGCYDYALKDVNPDDNTKGYWESLK